MEQKFQVGIFSSTHGVHGEFKVFPTTDDVKRFKQLKTVIMDTGKTTFEAQVENVKFFKQFAILKIKGYDSLNDIEPLKGSTLWVDRENAVKLEKDEYFVADLEGLQVVTDEGKELGILEEVLSTGANDVYIVKNSEGKEYYLPAIKECVLKVDMKKEIITVHMMPGLEEL